MPNTRSTPHVHHRVNPRYILRRQLNVDGRFRLPGEEIPEAATWPNLYAYLDLGWIEVLGHDEEDVPVLGATRPKIEVAIEKSIAEEPVTELANDLEAPIVESDSPSASEKPTTKPRRKGEPI